MNYTVMTSKNGRYRHLGSKERGMRTFCGKLLKHEETLIEVFGSVDLACRVCQSTNAYRFANAQLEKEKSDA